MPIGKLDHYSIRSTSNLPALLYGGDGLRSGFQARFRFSGVVALQRYAAAGSYGAGSTSSASIRRTRTASRPISATATWARWTAPAPGHAHRSSPLAAHRKPWCVKSPSPVTMC